MDSQPSPDPEPVTPLIHGRSYFTHLVDIGLGAALEGPVLPANTYLLKLNQAQNELRRSVAGKRPASAINDCCVAVAVYAALAGMAAGAL